MSLFHAGTVPALDSDGNPISGATWNFYATGTLTPRNVFADSGYVTSLGSQETADAAGRFDPIFLNDSTPTRAILKDAGGVTILDIDPATVSSGAGSIVSSIDVDGGTSGLVFTGGPVTSSGTIDVDATSALAVNHGGTGSQTASGARTNLSAAKSGANTDLTSLSDACTVAEVGTIAAASIGFRGLPQLTKTASYTLALPDAGKHISITTGGIVIPADASIAFPIGTIITIYNNSGSTQTLSITTDTLRWAGTTSTGSRTIAAYGLATVVKVDTAVWAASGNLT
jgi:hypothetical protein